MSYFSASLKDGKDLVQFIELSVSSKPIMLSLCEIPRVTLSADVSDIVKTFKTITYVNDEFYFGS